MYQYCIIHFKGEIIPGCNANKRKEAIEFFEGMMGAPFRFDKQDDYLCKKFKMEMVVKNETNTN